MVPVSFVPSSFSTTVHGSYGTPVASQVPVISVVWADSPAAAARIRSVAINGLMRSSSSGKHGRVPPLIGGAYLFEDSGFPGFKIAGLAGVFRQIKEKLLPPIPQVFPCPHTRGCLQPSPQPPADCAVE